MTYLTTLPHIDNMRRLKQVARPFPAAAGAILEKAQTLNFSTSTLDLVKLFPEEEIFETEDDFVNRCEELELLIREEQSMPAEVLRSPQD